MKDFRLHDSLIAVVAFIFVLTALIYQNNPMGSSFLIGLGSGLAIAWFWVNNEVNSHAKPYKS